MNSTMTLPRTTYLQDPNEIAALCDSLGIRDPDARRATVLMVSAHHSTCEVWATIATDGLSASALFWPVWPNA